MLRAAGAITWEFLTQKPSAGMREGGIFPAIVGTLYLIIGTMIISLPIGIFSAIYLNEYANKNKLTRIIRLSIVNMAGVPSVVFGLFGLAFFVLSATVWKIHSCRFSYSGFSNPSGNHNYY